MTVSRVERRWVLGFAVIVMVFTTLPYLLGFASQGEDWRFSGFVFGVEDGNSYLGKMLRGSAGEWLFRSPYTAISQRGGLFFLPYILLGKLVAPPGSHVQLISLYHLFRFGAGMLAILATYDFLAMFCKEVWARRAGTVLAILGGGLGWILLLIGQKSWLGDLPLDFYSPESFGFLGIFGIPHLALARALLLWSLVCYIGLVKSGKSVSSGAVIATGLIWLATSLAQPLAGMVVGFVIGVYLLALAGWQVWQNRRGGPVDWPRWRFMLRLALLAGLIPLPYWLYNILSFELDPFLRAWTVQNQITSPHPAHYLLAYGIVLPLVYWGARWILKKDPWYGWILVAWVLSLPLLAYAPLDLQRRLPEGVWVAMVTLVIVAIEQMRVKRTFRNSLLGGLFVACSISSLILWAGSLQAVLRPGQPLYIPADQARVFEYLQTHAGKDQVVLAAFNTGNALPAWTPQFVVIGHGPESAHFDDILQRVTAFFDGQSTDTTRLALIHEFDVDFIAWGSAERALGDWNPARATYLKEVFRQPDHALFQVIADNDENSDKKLTVALGGIK